MCLEIDNRACRLQMTRGRKEIGSQGVAPDTDKLDYFLRFAALWLLSERARFPQTS